MPAPAKVNLNMTFYQITSSAVKVNLTEVLQTIQLLRETGRADECLKSLADGEPLWTDHLTFTSSGRFWGNLARCDRTQTASRTKPGQTITPIELEAEEGLAQECAFVYDPAYNVLLLQRNQSGITTSRFLLYLSYFLGVSAKEIELRPLVRRDAYRRAMRRTSPRRLVVKLAEPSGHVYEGMNEDGKKVVDVATAAGAPRMEITWTLGHGPRDRALNEGFVGNILSAFHDKPGVEKLEIVGSDDEAEGAAADKIDLVEDVLKRTEQVMVGQDRTVSHGARLAVMDGVFNELETEIKAIMRR